MYAPRTAGHCLERHHSQSQAQAPRAAIGVMALLLIMAVATGMPAERTSAGAAVQGHTCLAHHRCLPAFDHTTSTAVCRAAHSYQLHAAADQQCRWSPMTQLQSTQQVGATHPPPATGTQHEYRSHPRTLLFVPTTGNSDPRKGIGVARCFTAWGPRPSRSEVLPLSLPWLNSCHCCCCYEPELPPVYAQH